MCHFSSTLCAYGYEWSRRSGVVGVVCVVGDAAAADGSHRLTSDYCLIAAAQSERRPHPLQSQSLYRGQKTQFYRSFIVAEHNNHAAAAIRHPLRQGAIDQDTL